LSPFKFDDRKTASLETSRVIRFRAQYCAKRLKSEQSEDPIKPGFPRFGSPAVIWFAALRAWGEECKEESGGSGGPEAGHLHRRFPNYGIPVRNAFGVDFRVGLAWGATSTSLLVGLIAAFGGYRILGLALHGGAIWYFLGLWIIANLLIGFSEELQFRANLLATLTDGIGFWPASILLSIGFGALHYFLKAHERWEDFVSTGLLGLFVCLTLRRTGSLAFAIGFHAAFDLASLFVWSGQNAGEYAVGHLLETRWQGSG
jgi:membrane protease YdiL (CAAX protease family)